MGVKTGGVIMVLSLAVLLAGCGMFDPGSKETRVSITGPGPIKCIVIQGGKEVTQDCPDTVTPAPVVVPPVVVAPPTE